MGGHDGRVGALVTLELAEDSPLLDLPWIITFGPLGTTIQPAGGHGVYVNAGELLPHIPNYEFPAQALAVELYREGGIRGVEIGSVMFACLDPETNIWHYPRLELLRLAIPRRTYTQSHMDYVAVSLTKIKSRAGSIHGYKFTYAPDLLRHFTARFEPL